MCHMECGVGNINFSVELEKVVIDFQSIHQLWHAVWLCRHMERQQTAHRDVSDGDMLSATVDYSSAACGIKAGGEVGYLRLPCFVQCLVAFFSDSVIIIFVTRLLYCVECPQYSTRRRSASNIHRTSMLRKTGRYGKPSNIIISLHRKTIFNYYEYSTNY